VLAKVATVALVLVGSGTLIPAAAGGQVNGVVRLRCSAENDANVTEEEVRIREDGNVHFKIRAAYVPGLLYARRPKHIQRGVGTDLADGPGGPTLYRRELPLSRGYWLVGCFDFPFSTADHPMEDYALIRVIR
jgi:hypothetical protein